MKVRFSHFHNTRWSKRFDKKYTTRLVCTIAFAPIEGTDNVAYGVIAVSDNEKDVSRKEGRKRAYGRYMKAVGGSKEDPEWKFYFNDDFFDAPVFLSEIIDFGLKKFGIMNGNEFREILQNLRKDK